MTNQEAISVLESIDAKTDYFLINDDARSEAINMAISALQAQECSRHKCRDTVSRQEAIEAVMYLCKHYTPTKSVNHPHMDFVIEVLQDLPSAQPEIIRCGDCKHYYFADNRIPQEQWYTCELDGDRWMRPDDYCSFAVRRTDEEAD